MPLRFGPYRPDEPAPRGRRGPPDYTSGRVKYRVFLLVAMVAFVVFLMSKARDPKNFAWMWKLDQQQATQAASQKDKPKDAGSGDVITLDKKPAAPSRTRPRVPISSGQILGGKQAAEATPPKVAPASEEQLADELLDRARKSGWTRVIEQLPDGERDKQHDLLFALLRSARARQALTDEERDAATRLLVRLDAGWTAYRADALASLASLPEDEQGAWQKLIDTLEADWTTITHPALQELVAGAELDVAEREALARLQTVLDELALAAVRDDTLPNRNAERFAWFRLFEILAGADPQDLQAQSHGAIGFVQLLKQAQDYRGKLVTVKGTIELGYRVPAFDNVEGIQEYYIFWLRPVGGDDSPLVIYALETPPGFPEVLAKSEDQTSNRLNAQVEITGYVFKRMAYSSKSGTLSTPLLLARAPVYEGGATPTLTRSNPIEANAATLSLVFAGAAALGLAVALFAYFTTRHTRRRLDPHEEPSPADFKSLQAIDRGKTDVL